jgi:hypothetical protein
MLPKWEMVETLLGGTSAMRAAGEDYLPRHAEEDGSNYFERLNSTTLYNMFELTLDTLVGKPFSDEIKLNDDVPEPIADITSDIDLRGNNITAFARHWFRESIAKGFAHIYIDMPALSEEDRAGRTRADDLQERRRPYWNFIKPENVIFAHAEYERGKLVYRHIRIKEELIEMDGFSEIVKQRIRVLEPGIWMVYEYRRAKNKTKGQWVLVEEGATGLDYIPFLTFYSDYSDLMVAKPPLEDLAFLNIRHWQSTSDQINVLTVARFPMLAVAGATDHTGSVMAIGPKQLLGTKDPNGRFYYVEHTGRAIEAGRQDLMDLEQMMASYGAEFLKRRPGNQTATARALDSAEAMSALQDVATRFQDILNKAMDITADWLSLDEGGTVDLITDFGPDKANAERLRTLLEARKNGDISREDFLMQLKEMQILTDDFDPTANLMRLMAEVALAGIDLSMVNQNDFRDDSNKNSKEETESEELQ